MEFIKLKFHKAVIRPATQYAGEHIDIVCEEKKKVEGGILSTYPALSLFNDYKVSEDKNGAFVTIVLPLSKQKAKTEPKGGYVVPEKAPF